MGSTEKILEMNYGFKGKLDGCLDVRYWRSSRNKGDQTWNKVQYLIEEWQKRIVLKQSESRVLPPWWLNKRQFCLLFSEFTLPTPTRPGLGVHDVTVRLHLRCLALFFSTSIEIETVSPGVVVIRNAFALLCCNWLLTQRIPLPILSRGICWHFCGSEGEHKRVDLSLARKKGLT